MPNRPKLLGIISLVFFGIIASFPLQAAFLYGHGLDEVVMILSKISLLNFLVVIIIALNIPLVLRASRWLALSLPLSLLLVSWNNWIVANVGHDVSPVTAWIATFGFALLTAFVFIPQVWTLLRHPQQRWWLQALRRAISLPMTIEPVRGSSIETKTFDLSCTGAFIPIDNWGLFEHPMREGDVINVKFNLGTLNRISCSAQIVRRTSPKGHYPSGIGLRFIGLQRGHDRLLRHFIRCQAPNGNNGASTLLH